MLVGVVVGCLVGAIVMSVVLNKRRISRAFENAQEESKKLLEEARQESDRLIKEAKNEAKQFTNVKRKEFEQETKSRRQEIQKTEKKINEREQNLEKKLGIMDVKEKELDELSYKLEQEDSRYKRLIVEAEEAIEHNRKTLQNIAKMTVDEAKQELIRTLEVDAKKEAAERLRRIEEDTKEQADRISRSMVSLAVQRIASEHVNDSTVTVVSLPSEDMKGRIIGREGRNIRAIEQATGVDLIIDDTPEAVIISCFNPIRREIAKITLERLIADGRIHPARIEETAQKVEEEFGSVIQENGEQACFEAGISDLHPELVKALGKLRYRSTGQQSALQHSVEVSHIAGIMASEIGLNVKRAKRAGLLHDIGKSVEQEVEGHHAKIGAELCQKYQESSDVVEAVGKHHQDDLSQASPYAVIVHAANLLSESRPGARKELLESYVKRLQEMEDMVRQFRGIDAAYVIQSGREVRAMVSPEGVSDDEMMDLSNEIATSLRKELTFPGQVKVTVVRESKFTDYAK